jgi:hypothetical protein
VKEEAEIRNTSTQSFHGARNGGGQETAVRRGGGQGIVLRGGGVSSASQLEEDESWRGLLLGLHRSGAEKAL